MHVIAYYRVLGTPNEESWPGVSQLPDYKPTFPQWSSQSLTKYIPHLDSVGIDLLYVSVAVPISLNRCRDFSPILTGNSVEHYASPDLWIGKAPYCFPCDFVIVQRRGSNLLTRLCT